jgi:integrase
MAGQRTSTTPTGIRGGTVTLAEAADAFLSSLRAASPNTRRAYAGVLDRLAADLDPGRQLAAVPGDEIAGALRRLWGGCAPATWNRNRAAVVSWLNWCTQKKRWAAPQLPGDAERRRENSDRTRALPRGRVERLLSRRGIPLREKTLWRMLYETAARASEILGLNVEDLDLEQRRAAVRSKGGDTEFVYWDTGTAHLLPRLLRLPDGTSRASGPLFLASRRPVPARRPAPRDICPHTGRGRLGYDRARILFRKYTATTASGGLELHQLRHSAATHLGDQKVPLQLIMAKTRHKSPRTVMRYVQPGDEAVAEVTSLLGPNRRTH